MNTSGQASDMSLGRIWIPSTSGCVSYTERRVVSSTHGHFVEVNTPIKYKLEVLQLSAMPLVDRAKVPFTYRLIYLIISYLSLYSCMRLVKLIGQSLHQAWARLLKRSVSPGEKICWGFSVLNPIKFLIKAILCNSSIMSVGETCVSASIITGYSRITWRICVKIERQLGLHWLINMSFRFRGCAKRMYEVAYSLHSSLWYREVWS